jgi:hypothetical protein
MCPHDRVIYLGEQEGIDGKLYNCLDCLSTIVLSEKDLSGREVVDETNIEGGES